MLSAFPHTLAKTFFLNDFRFCIVYSHVCLLAVFFFTAFVGALLHLLVHYYHRMSISGIACNDRM